MAEVPICSSCDMQYAVMRILGFLINKSRRIIITILALIFVALNCRPFAATWNPYLGSCQTQISMTTVSIIVSAVQMCTDWACAVIPFFIVAGLQMSTRKKVSVIIILGLGVVASICTVIRLPYLKYYDTATYPTQTLCECFLVNVPVLVNSLSIGCLWACHR